MNTDVSPSNKVPFRLEREMFTVLISERKRRQENEDMDKEYVKKFQDRLDRKAAER